METFATIAIVIIVIIIIIIIVVIIIFAINSNRNNNNNNTCGNQNDCQPGYVCFPDSTNNSNSCKAGLGIPCNSDSDCVPDFTCKNNPNGNNQICTPRETTLKSPPIINSNIPKRKVTIASPPELSIPDLPTTRSIIIPKRPMAIRRGRSFISNSDSVTPLSDEIIETMRNPINNINAEKNNFINTDVDNTHIDNTHIDKNNVINTHHIDKNNFGDERSVTPLSNNIIESEIHAFDDNNNSHPHIFDVQSHTSDKIRHGNNFHSHTSDNFRVKSPVIENKEQSINKININNTHRHSNITPLTDFNTESFGTKETNSDDVLSEPKIKINMDREKIHEIPKDINRSRKKRVVSETDVTPIDYEINSDGNYTDPPFDVRSGDSTDKINTRRTLAALAGNNVIESVSTPCEEKDGVYYCRNLINIKELHQPWQEHKTTYHSPVIDVCSYSNATLFLLDDGNIICEINENSDRRYRTSNNIKLRKITSFNGYLYGVSVDKILYTLPNAYFADHNNNWIWSIVNWAPRDIKHISSTHDGSHIWIQTNSTGYLYNNPNVIIDKIPYHDGKRVYGRDNKHYIDIKASDNNAYVFPGNNLHHNIYDAALSYYDEVIAIHPSEKSEYRSIVIVNWHPYYIRA